ncbi:unnamed protein product [Arctia plantaginis]|uniref:Uncharacterized protein n=1 Tax=Arctia plantaginis TaxID=874455 RepID=A0A8S1BRC7_ARCPL|nr:unnamed protein product [Arctia plantaginis]
MAFVFKTFLTLLTYLIIVQDVSLLPIDLNLNHSRTTEDLISSYDDKSGEVLVRIRKASVKVGSCPRGKERYKGRCRTQEEIQLLRYNDYDDNVTEPALYEVVPLIRKETVPKSGIVHKYEIPTSTAYDIETSTVTLLEVTDSELDNTESTLDIDAKEIHAVSPTLIFEDDNGADSERLKNLTYTLLIVFVAVVVLFWLFKLLYNYLRREDDTVSHSCSNDEVCGAMSSRCRLCS